MRRIKEHTMRRKASLVVVTVSDREADREAPTVHPSITKSMNERVTTMDPNEVLMVLTKSIEEEADQQVTTETRRAY